MSDQNIESKSKSRDLKRAFIEVSLKEILEENNETITTEQFTREVTRVFEEVKNNPLYQQREITRNELPFREDFENDMTTIREDLSILNKENKNHGQFLKDSFNSVYSEKKRIMQRIDSLNSLTGDMFLITDDANENVQYITESFNDANALDTDFSVENISKGSIQTQEGVLTLERTGSRNLSEAARVAHYSGNGTPGVNQLSRKSTSVNQQGEPQEVYEFLNEGKRDIYTRMEDVLDNQPDTLFEYQMVNVPFSFKKKRRFYDFDWAEGAPEGERLRLKVIFELPKEEDVNWITLMPYYPNNSSGRLTIHSIRTSVDGFDYLPLYNNTVLNQDINITPQTYRLGDIFTGETTEESGLYQGKGLWSFPERKARFIEFVIDQQEAYPETLGQAVYYLSDSDQTYPVQVPEPEELREAAPGRHIRTVDGRRLEYLKEIQASADGWRYSIGLRDVNIMQFQFNEKSEFVSKRYELPRNIQKLNLYAKEIIPESYLDIVRYNNDWIQYEVSFDDINWHRISPMHQEPLSDNFPPKIIELNTSLVDLTNVFQVHKEVIEAEDVRHLRFRVAIQRPIGDGFEATTPMLEELAFKIEMEDTL